jgi:Calcineurin-like phosphoesterase
VGLILGVNDIHATRRPPSSCTDSYWPDLLDLLYQSAEVARVREAVAAVWAGDVLHHKAPGRTDHGLMQDLIRVVKAYPCPVLIVPGNHDMQHDRPDSIDETQPLGVLFESGVARRLEGWADGNLPLFGVPWQQSWSEERILACTADFRERVFSQTLIVTHAPIYPPGREPHYEGAEVTPASWWAGALEDGSLGHGLLYGHIHEPHGTYRAGTALTFCNYGALSRGSLDEYNLSRQVGVSLWDTFTGEFEFVPLRAKPASEVFRLRQHGEAVTARRSLDDFRAGVEGVTLDVLSIEGVLAHIETLGVDRDIKDLAAELLAGQGGMP